MTTPTLPSSPSGPAGPNRTIPDGTAVPDGTARSDRDEGGGGRRPSPGQRVLRVGGPIVVIGLLVAAGVRFFTDPDPAPTTAVPTQPADVIAGLEVAVANRPEDLRAWQQLGGAYLDEAALSGDPSRYDQAAAAFDAADRLVPDETGTVLGRASLALSQHQFDQARRFGEVVLAQRPGNAEALAVLIDANVELGRYDTASALSEQLLATKPGTAALTRSSYQRELRGDLPGALRTMVQAEAAAGGADPALTGADARSTGALGTVVALQGDILFASGDPIAAAARYRRALELAPGSSLAIVGLARTEAAAGDVGAATERLEELVARAPTLGAATLLGDLQRLAGQPPTGDDLVDVIVQLERSSGATVDLELAVHLADRGRPDVALAQAAYAERPSVYGADALAWALTRAGRAQEAIPYVEQSLSLGTADAALRFRAAVAFDAAGDPARAARELRTAVDDNPFFTFGLRAEATTLAQRLGVAVPAGWGG